MKFNITPVTKEQLKKVVKALAYSFAAGFVGTLTLQGVDFLQLAVDGTSTGTIVEIVVALIAASVIGGINAVFVYIKQLFTTAK